MNTPLENIFADIAFISHAVKKFNYADYELYKKRIDRPGLPPDEYSAAIKRLSEALGI